MIGNKLLKEIEAEIKAKLGDTVHKCGIAIILFDPIDSNDGRDVWEFGNIESEDRMRLYMHTVAAYAIEVAKAKAELEDSGDKPN